MDARDSGLARTKKPPPGKLPSTKTQGTTPFQVLGVDAGPIRYVTRNKAERKPYLLHCLTMCSIYGAA